LAGIFADNRRENRRGEIRILRQFGNVKNMARYVLSNQNEDIVEN
jgi:hypothetical protein